jgi:hypothetical protein
MTQIFVHHDPTVVGLYQSIVAEAGIPCFVRDEVNLDVLATIPLPAHSPTLCVNQDEDAERAVAIIREYQRTVASDIATHGADWVCPQCGETVPASFGSCWKCEAVRPTDA